MVRRGGDPLLPTVTHVLNRFVECGSVSYCWPVNHLEFAMNIELDEVVVQDVSDDALELAAGGAQGGFKTHYDEFLYFWC